MKKVLVIGLLSIAGISASVRDAEACIFGCWHGRCCNSCCAEVCIRPYNAFTPAMCCPIYVSGCLTGSCQQRPSCFGGASYGPGYCSSGCCDAGCLPAPGTVISAPQSGPIQVPGVQSQPLPPGAMVPQYQVPNPQVFNPSSYMMPTQPAYGYGQVQPAAYYQPAYNPYAYTPAPVNYYGPLQAPSYWYGR